MLVRAIKFILPRSLFGRALLILVAPMVLIQALATYMFYERHWDNVSRWMASSLAGEIALLVHEMNDAPKARQQKLILFADRLMNIKLRLEEKNTTEKFLRSGQEVSPIFFNELEYKLNIPFSLALSDDLQDILLRIKLPDAVLHITVSRKRLVSSTTYIFVMWMLGSAALLTGIAIIFLRNQIRPITKLARAMDSFGKGHDTPGFRPQGAEEVRRAGHAFAMMKQRLDRQISARMEMLAGISHDLRTPLTRMKLQLELLTKADKQAVRDLQSDITDMEHMIAEYLDFVRGEGQEPPQRLILSECLKDILARYHRQGQEIQLVQTNEMLEIDLRPQVFRRAITNVVENALRYGKDCLITVRQTRHHAEIYIDDNGPGIPYDKREEVFKPFKRLDLSRNIHTGGVGLGLTIARDIIHGHGGEILLQEAPKTSGLRVVIRLPLPSV